jgi:hypothetical protein
MSRRPSTGEASGTARAAARTAAETEQARAAIGPTAKAASTLVLPGTRIDLRHQSPGIRILPTR